MHGRQRWTWAGAFVLESHHLGLLKMGHDRSFLPQYNRTKSGITQNTMANNSTKPKVHPLFARARFPNYIRYKDAFYDAAVLATRLMDSPQALQHDYCFYFGVNMPIDFPRSVRRYLEPSERPAQYAINKGVGELDDRDIQAVRDERLKLAPRISYEVGHTGSCGYCDMQQEVDGISGRDSVIRIDTTLYQAARDKNLTPEDNARAILNLACTMVHEAGHAAHHHLFGDKAEDFRECSLVAETGYELEARIFGAHPDTDDSSFGAVFKSWQSWETHSKIPARQNEPNVRHGSALRIDDSVFVMEDSFVLKLCDDDFWSGEYVRRGTKALIPKDVATSCRKQRDRYMKTPGVLRANTKIPLSIRDLFRSGGPSYAKSIYDNCWNLDLILRSEQTGPESDVVSSGEDSAESDGSLFCSSGEENSDSEDGDFAEESVEEDVEEDGDNVEEEDSDVEEEAGDVDEDGMSVDEDEMSVDEDGMDPDEDDMDVDEDEAPAPKKGKASAKPTGSKHARDDSNYEDEAPAPKKTKTPTKKSKR
jgi:hypothetical protein